MDKDESKRLYERSMGLLFPREELAAL